MVRVIVGLNDFPSLHPKAVFFWDYEKNSRRPEEFSAGSGQDAHWKCAANHSWVDPIRRVIKNEGRECPYCNKRIPIPGETDLKTLFPKLADSWDYEVNLKGPENYFPNSNEKVGWICKKGHKWKAIIESRTRNGYGCPYCTNRKALKGYNDLQFKFPKVAEEWCYELNGSDKPDEIVFGSNKYRYWKCQKKECGYIWRARVFTRTLMGCGCPACAGNIVVEGKNDLETVNPLLAKELDPNGNGGLSGKQIAANSPKKRAWICAKGHKWKASVASRNNGCGCPTCMGKVVNKGVNDLETRAPHLALEWDYDKNNGHSPGDYMYMSNKSVAWKCIKYGHKWRAQICSRMSGSGCPVCAGKKVCAGFNDLAFVYPDLAMEWNTERNHLKADEVVAHSNKKRWWTCKNGHEWKASINSRVRGNGCMECYRLGMSSDNR